MFEKLLWVRIRSAVNLVRFRFVANPISFLLIFSAGVGIFVSITFGFYFLLKFVSSNQSVLDETVVQIFLFLFVFLFASAVPFVSGTLLQANDLDLLCTVPISRKVVIASKLLDATVTNSLQFSVIGLPAIVAVGFAYQSTIWGWVLLLLLIFQFALMPALVTALALLLSLLVTGIERLRGAMTTVNLAMALFVCATFVIQTSSLPVQINGSGGLEVKIANHSPLAHSMPSSWFARTFFSFSRSQFFDAFHSVFLILGSNLLLFVGCVLLGEKFLTASASIGEAKQTSSSLKSKQRDSSLWLEALLAVPVLGIIAKDLKYVQRDNILLSQMVMPVILFFAPFAVTLQPEMRRMLSDHEFFYLSSGIIVIILFMQTSILSLTAVGIEGRSFVHQVASPNKMSQVLQAKFLLSWIFTASISGVLCGINGLIFQPGIFELFLFLVTIAIASFALCGIGIGLSASFPSFVYENPAHRVSPWAMIIGFVASMIYLILSIVIIVSTYMAGSAFQDHSVMIALGGSSLFIVVSFVPAILLMVGGARNLEKYQWTH